ncbi:MAG: N-acyl-D-amino-acid deacylase family protein [Lachnospirales bacterium]
MIIRKGNVYTGKDKCEKKDIIIENDKIKDIGHFENYQGEEIDATDLTVCPSFIDAHRHCDLAIFKEEFGDIELRQGISTILSGNCGLSAIFPRTSKYKEEIENYLEPCLGRYSLNINSYEDYINKIPYAATNINNFVAVGTTLAATRGYKKNITNEEIKKARYFIDESLEAGAVGVSSGIMYQPECYMNKINFIEMLQPLKKYNRPFVTHVRGEGNNLLPSLKEVIDIAKEVNVPLTISHFKATGIKNWNKEIYKAIELIESERKNIDITVDFYPYNGGSTTLISLIPPVLMKDTIAETIAYLDTKEGKISLKENLLIEHQNWDNMALSIGWEKIVISSCSKKEYIGKNFIEATSISKFDSVADFLCDLLVLEKGNVSIIVLSMDTKDIYEVAKLPYGTIISDSLYGNAQNPHPRLYGTYGTILTEYINKKVLTLEEGIRKMTIDVAEKYNLKNIGEIKKGNYANINIFDTITNVATFKEPKLMTSGFKYVILNGQITLKNDIVINKKCGNFIRLTA